jgi:hypothetical protein
MHTACWITKATDIHSEYVILVAFPWQQCFCKRALMLRYTYIASVVIFIIHDNTVVDKNYVKIDLGSMLIENISRIVLLYTCLSTSTAKWSTFTVCGQVCCITCRCLTCYALATALFVSLYIYGRYVRWLVKICPGFVCFISNHVKCCLF